MLDRVAGEVAQRLREAVGVGAERAGGDRRELEAALGGEAHAVPQLRDERPQVDRLDVQELPLFGLREQQQIVDQARDARDLGLHEALDAADLRERRIGLRAEHLELAADHRQRRAQLVRGVGDERALAGERVGRAGRACG